MADYLAWLELRYTHLATIRTQSRPMRWRLDGEIVVGRSSGETREKHISLNAKKDMSRDQMELHPGTSGFELSNKGLNYTLHVNDEPVQNDTFRPLNHEDEIHLFNVDSGGWFRFIYHQIEPPLFRVHPPRGEVRQTRIGKDMIVLGGTNADIAHEIHQEVACIRLDLEQDKHPLWFVQPIPHAANRLRTSFVVNGDPLLNGRRTIESPTRIKIDDWEISCIMPDLHASLNKPKGFGGSYR